MSEGYVDMAFGAVIGFAFGLMIIPRILQRDITAHEPLLAIEDSVRELSEHLKTLIAMMSSDDDDDDEEEEIDMEQAGPFLERVFSDPSLVVVVGENQAQRL